MALSLPGGSAGLFKARSWFCTSEPGPNPLQAFPTKQCASISKDPHQMDLRRLQNTVGEQPLSASVKPCLSVRCSHLELYRRRSQEKPHANISVAATMRARFKAVTGGEHTKHTGAMPEMRPTGQVPNGIMSPSHSTGTFVNGAMSVNTQRAHPSLVPCQSCIQTAHLPVVKFLSRGTCPKSCRRCLESVSVGVGHGTVVGGPANSKVRSPWPHIDPSWAVKAPMLTWHGRGGEQ